VPIKVIARTMGISKNTVRKALRDGGPPKYERAVRGSLVDEVEPRIRELLRVTPTMPATVVAERIGWEHSIRTLRTRVSDLRPVYLPPDPASRTIYEAGSWRSSTSGSPTSSCRSGSARCGQRSGCR
jgi:transposase